MPERPEQSPKRRALDSRERMPWDPEYFKVQPPHLRSSMAALRELAEPETRGGSKGRHATD